MLTLSSQINANQQSHLVPLSSAKTPKPPKSFDPSKYSTRLISLKFAYLGGSYNGFEHHPGNTTPLPTVEEELWKALVKCRLIFPPSLKENGLLEGNLSEKLDAYKTSRVPVDWDGCEYSKCGRTDRGVSAFGQVIAVRVRSARQLKIKKWDVDTELSVARSGRGNSADVDPNEKETVDNDITAETDTFDPIK